MTIVETWALMDTLTRLIVVMFTAAILICTFAIIEDLWVHNLKPAWLRYRRQRAYKRKSRGFSNDPR